MSLKRICLLCNQPVSIRRRMSLFCSDRCEHRYRALTQAPPRLPQANAAPRMPQDRPAPRR